MDAKSRSRTGLFALIVASAFLMSCDKILGIPEVTPYPNDAGPTPNRPYAGLGTFVSSFAVGSKDQIEIRGELFWNSAVHGTKDGITIEGSIQ